MVPYRKWHQSPSRKPGPEIRIDFSSGDNAQSWVRNSNGLNKFVRDLTETSRIPDEEENNSARTEQPGSQELRTEPYSQKQKRKTQRKGKIGTEFEFYSVVSSGTSSDSWEEMAWRWTRSEQVQNSQTWHLEENAHIASTRTGYSSTRRRSSWILETEKRHQRTSTPIFHILYVGQTTPEKHTSKEEADKRRDSSSAQIALEQ